MTQQPEFTPRRGSVPSHYEAPKNYEIRPKSLLIPWAIAASYVLGGVLLIGISVGTPGRLGALMFGTCFVIVGCLTAWGLSRSKPT
jgi:hypothetical protein